MNSNEQSGTITKKELVETVAQKLKMHPSKVLSMMQMFLDEFIDALGENKRVELRGFGVFEVVRRKKKVGRNPKKAALDIVIPERNAVKFTPGKRMKIMIDQQVK